MRLRLRRLVLAVLGVLMLLPLADPARAQVVRLDRPDAVLRQREFSFVRGVRELPDGKVLVADWVEEEVVLADFTTGAVRVVVPTGSGPAEVRLPSGLVAHRGDTTLLVDLGNNRVTFLGPDGRAVRSILAEAPGIGGVRGVDARGRFLFAIPSWAEGPDALPDDSVRIVRWLPGSDERERVAVVQSTRWRKDRSPTMVPRIPTVGFAAQDAWVVSSTGEVTIVRAQPYRVEVLGADGRVRRGEPVATTVRAVSAQDRTRFVQEFSAAAPQSGRGEDGGMGRAPAASAAEVARLVTTTEFSELHPPFEASGVFAAPGGRTWVRRPHPPGTPSVHDVFDADGRRIMQVELPAGRRVAHVGARGVYAVVEDGDGVQTLERYRAP
jgi:hypothetical protein